MKLRTSLALLLLLSGAACQQARVVPPQVVVAEPTPAPQPSREELAQRVARRKKAEAQRLAKIRRQSEDALERGRENFRRNQLKEKDHRFWKEDVRKALPRLHRRGETFDAIILDPPTFAHGGRGRAFRIEKEIEPMLTACLQLLRPAGVLLVSINESHTALGDLEKQIRPLLHRAKIPARLEPSRRPPEVPAVRMPAGVWVFRED
jgi:hypothetical protein